MLSHRAVAALPLRNTHSRHFDTYFTDVTASTRTPSSRVVAVVGDVALKLSGWRWVGGDHDNWTEVQVLRRGVVVHERSVSAVASPMFEAMLSVYVGEEAAALVEEVRAALHR